MSRRPPVCAVEQWFDPLFAQNPDAVYAMDLSGRFTAANSGVADITGYPISELKGLSALKLVAPEDQDLARERFRLALDGTSQAYEVGCITRDGRRIDVRLTNVPIVVDGQVVGVYAVAKETTLRRRLLDLTRPITGTDSVREQVRMILNAMRDVLPYASGGLYWIDRETNLLRPTELVEATWVSPELGSFNVPLGKGVMGTVALGTTGELVNNAHLDPRTMYPDDAVVTCEHLIVVPVSVDGRTVGVFYVARRADPPFSEREFDIAQLFVGHAAGAIEKTHMFEQTRASEDRFHHQALHDPLTELPNRVLLHDRLGQAIVTGTRTAEPVTLLVLDLDRFKEVNDTLGHQSGDRLLQEVSTRFRASVRASDTVARLGGDEFAVLLPGTDAATAAVAAAKLLAALDRPVVLEGFEFLLGASLGIATFPDHGADADTLLRRADMAKYEAKRAGGGFASYTSELDLHSAERLGRLAELRRAIATDELTLHYQPQIDCTTGALTGFEALVRWWHPERGLIGPDQFVPLAEQSGLIRDLTRWVLSSALGQSHIWRGWLGPDIAMSVNLSSHDLLDPRLPDFVAEQLERCQFPARQLILEITESALLGDGARALEVLRRLRQMGVRVALDDFGTGYSSLSYLKDWPVDELKVDRAFVSSMVADKRDRSIVRAMVDLAHTLDLEVVAEGVEDEAILRLLATFGCDRAQGYHVARPMPAVELLRWLHLRGQGNVLVNEVLAA
jgi:diguanylate cyclase (GGDEF)-like protein/PAS domain S-box-containing protein